jgi:hypothetical protein
MTLDEALDIVATDHLRYRWLCSEDNPDVAQRDAYRALVIRRATGEPEAPMPGPILTTSLAQEFAAPPSTEPPRIPIPGKCCGGS